MVNWQNIDNVLLDMDGTLLDLSFDNYFWLEFLPQKISDHKTISLEEATKTVTSLSESTYGSLLWYCLDHWSEKLEMDVEALKKEVRHRIKMRPHCQELLSYLKNLNKRVILVTNAHPKALAIKVTASGLHEHMEEMISSHELELAKENDGFWEKLGNRECIDLTRSLFIDDSLPVLECAQRSGIKHLIQVLHPDSNSQPLQPSQFQGIIHLDELMVA
ncbi:MAG: GMP/IMP nucleotidase [Gammaproteobacteria bacterium]|nr:GMP/IMP nucleotidase [Gammaproteobacteria bacterium]